MLSVFPLVAITLGNNILETVSTPVIVKNTFMGPRKMKILKFLCRLAAALPPIILGALFGKLDSVGVLT